MTIADAQIIAAAEDNWSSCRYVDEECIREFDAEDLLSFGRDIATRAMLSQDKRDALILANVRRVVKKTRMPNWVLAMETFGFGSTSAWEMCGRIGLDPESNVTSLHGMMDHIEKTRKEV